MRNGSVVDLQIERGLVRAMVSGSSIYKVKIDIGAISQRAGERSSRIARAPSARSSNCCQGKLSKNVMERVCRERDGLFPSSG